MTKETHPLFVNRVSPGTTEIALAERLPVMAATGAGRALVGDRVLVFQEHDDDMKPTGRSAAFSGVEFSPLQYVDLIDKKLSNRVVIPLNWTHAKVVESNIPEIIVDQIASGNATLNSTYTSRSIGLVSGGWLPSGLAVTDSMIVMPDRCTICELKGRFKGGIKTNKVDMDFLDFFSGEGIRINPLLYALEGNVRKNPTPEVIEQQLEEVFAALRSALPQAELVPADGSGLHGVIGIVQNTHASMARKQDFLMRLAPKLQAPTSARKKAPLWDEVLLTAQHCGITKNSLVVLAVLSSISVPMGKSPAKRLLKLTNDYSMEDSYNALADLRSLEILICLLALFPDQRLMLVTEDKDLALLWTGMRASGFTWTGKHASFELSPIEALLPNMTEAQRASFLGRGD